MLHSFKLRVLFAVFFSFILVGGCSKHRKNMPPKLSETLMHSAIRSERDLSESAVAVSQSLADLAALKAQESRPNIMQRKEVRLVRHGFGGQANVHWVGPVGPLIKRVASQSGYRFKTVGTEPAIPVFVRVDREGISLSDLIEEIRNAVIKHAEVTVDVASKTMILRYYPV